jgi:hypothetical protein
MTIVVKVFTAPLEPEVQQLAVNLTDESINQLHSILQRALNCADPKLYPDWVELCDKLDTLKRDSRI